MQLEQRHHRRAHRKARIRAPKDTELRNLPFRSLDANPSGTERPWERRPRSGQGAKRRRGGEPAGAKGRERPCGKATRPREERSPRGPGAKRPWGRRPRSGQGAKPQRGSGGRSPAGWGVGASPPQNTAKRETAHALHEHEPPSSGAAGNRTRVLRRVFRASPCAVRCVSARISGSRERARMTIPVAVCCPVPLRDRVGQ